MKLGKILAILVLLVIVVIVAIAGATFVYIDSIAKAGVERGTTYALDVPTTLRSADVGVLSGTFGMSGLNVSNPEGFDSDHFLTLGEGGVAVSLGTLRQDTVRLPILKLEDIDVVLERAEGKSNYKVILENLKRFESGGKPKEPSASKGSGKKFVIERIEIRNVNAHVSLLPIGGDLTKVDVTVPEVILTDVKQEGMELSQLVNVLTQAILTSVVKVGGGIIPTDILGDLQGGLGALGGLGDVGVQVLDGAGEVVAEIGNVAGEVGKGVGEAVEGVGKGAEEVVKGIGGILGGGDDDEDDDEKDE